MAFKARKPTGIDETKRTSLGEPFDVRVGKLTRWFTSNFAPVEGRIPDNFVHGGPFEAETEMRRAFGTYFTPEEYDKARRRLLLAHRTDLWTVAKGRLRRTYDPKVKKADFKRREDDDSHATIVETILYPKADLGWTLHVTFVPGDTNVELGQEGVTDGRLSVQDPVQFNTINGMVGILIKYSMRSNVMQRKTLQWLDQCHPSEALFTDEKIIIHGSPLDWLDLRKAVGVAADGAAASAILVSSPDLARSAVILAAYGGSRMFLRLVYNANYLMDAYFERMRKKILLPPSVEKKPAAPKKPARKKGKA
jgi:hypothetical protein